jgi:hypothetical protein
MAFFRRASTALALCVSLVAAGLVNATPAAAIHPPYLIHSVDSHGSLCIDLAYASTDNGARIQQWPCYIGPAQQWYPNNKVVVDGINYYELLSGSYNGEPKCIEVPWGNPAAGQALQLWDCLGAARQLWSMEFLPDSSLFTMKNLQTHQCMEIPWNTPTVGGVIQQWPCYNGEAQQWYRQQG